MSNSIAKSTLSSENISDYIAFAPQNPLTIKQIRINRLFFPILLFGFMTWEIITRKPIIPASIFVGIGLLYLLLSFCYTRFPIAAIINKKTRVIKVDYLNLSGNKKSAYIDLKKAIVRFGITTANGGYRLWIYDNIFNNYIKFDRHSNFKEEELRKLREIVKAVKKGIV